MTKKYTSKEFNKLDEFHDDQDNSFYDVSFDLPIDEDTDRHSSPNNESAFIDSTHNDKSTKWDDFYEDFKVKQDANFEQAKQEQVEINKTNRQTQVSEESLSESPLSSDLYGLEEDVIQHDAAKSSIMLERSIRKVKSLFSDFDNYEPPVSNPYKAEVTDALKQRGANFVNKDSNTTQAKEEPHSGSLDSVSDKGTSKWFNRFRQTSKEQVNAFDETENATNHIEDLFSVTQTTEKETSKSEQTNDSTNLTSGGLLKKMFTPPKKEDDLSEKEPTLPLGDSAYSDKDHLVNEGNDSSFKQTFTDTVPSNKKSTDLNNFLLDKHASNNIAIDKDYFDSQNGVLEDSNLINQHSRSLHSTVSQSEKTDATNEITNLSLNKLSMEPESASPPGRRYSSDLPSPEEIRKERERRRRLRVQELEQMTSSEEVEQTYKQSYSDWLKEFNKNSSKKGNVIINKDNSTDETSTFITQNSDEQDITEEKIMKNNFSDQSDLVIEMDSIDNTFEESAIESDSVDLDTNYTTSELSEKTTKILDDIQSVDDTPETITLIDDNVENEDLDKTHLVIDSQQAIEGNSTLEESSTLDQTNGEVDNETLKTEEATIIPNLVSDDKNEKAAELTASDQSLTQDGWLDSSTIPFAKESVSDFPDDSSVNNNDDISTVNVQDASEDTVEITETNDKKEEDILELGPLKEAQVNTVPTKESILDLTQVNVAATESDETQFTVIHEPVDVTEIDKQMAAGVEANLLAESIPIYKRKDKETKKEIYSLASLSTKERIFFALNITFNVIKRISLYFILIGILVGAMGGGVGFGYFANLVSKTPPPSSEEMATAINRLEQQSTLYYASGEPIANIRADVVRTITNIDEISPYIIDGLIATEDEDFYNHPGVMPKAIFRAVIESILTDDGSGGSTLTQQLVKQQLLSPDVTFFRKANEILLALRLENYFTKDQILMAYLNVSPFGRNNNGDNVAGIMKASEGIFGVKPNEVTLNQAAFLVGLPQDPYTYTPYDQLGALLNDFQAGIERMQEVLYRMYREKKITKEQYDVAMVYDITQDFLPQETRDEQRQSYLYQAMMNGAIEQLMLLNIREDGYNWKTIYEDVEWYNEYYFAAEEQLRTGGYKVYTTIDKEIYDHLQISAVTYDDQLGATYDGIFTDPETGAETYYIESVQTGIVVIDNKTGKVLGFVAGTDFENNQIDHAFNMRRSPGSTIKPLAVYGPAIEENLINPSTIIPDTAFVQTLSDGTEYRPTNYGEVISGTYYSARTALMKSDNIPTVRIYDQLVSRKVPIIDYLEKMGFNTVDSYTETETQYLSFALGGVGAGPTVFEQTRAFSTFANNGQYVDGYYIERIEDTFGNVVFQQNNEPIQVFSEDSNYLMVDMLRDTMDGGSGQTAGGIKNFGGDWIAKSGISENSKDIWFIGSTPSITIGSWIGYDNQYAEYVFDLNDGFDREAVRSQTYWGNIVNDLYAFRPDIFGINQSFTQPESVQSQTVLQTTGTLPGSLQINNRTYQVTSPTYEDLFKKSNPAPALSFNFMFNAADSDHQTFWAQFAQNADQQRQQQQPQSSSSSSSSESEESSGDETTETPPEESTPEAPPTQETPPSNE